MSGALVSGIHPGALIEAPGLSSPTGGYCDPSPNLCPSLNPQSPPVASGALRHPSVSDRLPGLKEGIGLLREAVVRSCPSQGDTGSTVETLLRADGLP